ncbi:MAG TPA: phosphatase PAP2 family protein [Rhizomicrobium sp.]|nr:phosphatase PAP2 family protein [Rhizomicrobium sp.]
MKLPIADPKAAVTLSFAPEWIALCVLALVDVLFATKIGFHLQMRWQDFGMLATVFAVGMALRLFGQTRGGLIAEFLALSLAMAIGFTIFSYMCMAVSGPLADAKLLAIDRAMGFDWMAGWKLISVHPLAMRIAGMLYQSLTWQAVYLCILLGLMLRTRNMRETFWAIFLSALITNLIAIGLPAFGPFQTFGLASHGEYLPDMKYLKSGADLTFALSKMTGVISFPSFHTVMALGYTYGLRKTGIIGYGIAALNAVMLFTVPFIGGHYLIDMIAGAATLIFAVMLVKLAPMLWRRIALRTSHEPAAAVA